MHGIRGKAHPAWYTLTRRLPELEIHHVDLGIGYQVADWPDGFAAERLPGVARSFAGRDDAPACLVEVTGTGAGVPDRPRGRRGDGPGVRAAAGPAPVVSVRAAAHAKGRPIRPARGFCTARWEIKAHQALYLARPDEAVDLARAAQAAAARYGSATLLTECLVTEAHGHAARNDARACGAVLARAKQTFDRTAREDEPAWLSYFDEAYLAARMAQCFRDLGEAGHAAATRAAPWAWTAATSAAGPFNLSLLATAYAAQGEPVQASAVGRQALDLTVRLTSARSVRYVRDLVRMLRPQADIPGEMVADDRSGQPRVGIMPCTTGWVRSARVRELILCSRFPVWRRAAAPHILA